MRNSIERYTDKDYFVIHRKNGSAVHIKIESVLTLFTVNRQFVT